jgi:hypothetical protein
MLYVATQLEQCYSDFDSHWKLGYMLANFMFCYVHIEDL